ncbi:hypothetical protein LY78DRAFT_369908 [Colletotrichum sublineola]|nr:hypothetical protein LY78DRAFT_369908 [Colletotrichum sublineola]
MASSSDIITLDNFEQLLPRWDPAGTNHLYALVDMGRSVGAVFLLIEDSFLSFFSFFFSSFPRFQRSPSGFLSGIVWASPLALSSLIAPVPRHA